jgi:hypothetical protein
MYSSLQERYWRDTYAGAGRSLPPGTGAAWGTILAGGTESAGVNNAGVENAGAKGATSAKSDSAESAAPGPRPAVQKTPEKAGGQGAASGSASGSNGDSSFSMGIAIAPSWNGLYEAGTPLRGGAAQLRFAAEIHPFGRSMLPGIELRPEWDYSLNVFRMPITLSWGLDDRFRIFFGPAFTIGNATLQTAGGERHYAGGNAWIGAAGLSLAPFQIPISRGKLAPYVELAWQSYYYDGNSGRNVTADLAAGLRFSTGLSYTWKL